MKRFLAMFLAVLMLIGMMAGCGSDDTTDPADDGGSTTSDDSASSDKVIKVAAMAPLTGAAARSGEEIKNGVEMQLDNIDYKIGDYTVELYWVDSQSDSEKSAMAYEECIVNNDVDCGLLNWHSWVSISCMEVAAKYQIPHFFGIGAGYQKIHESQEADWDYYKYWVGCGWPDAVKLTSGYVSAVNEAIDNGTWTPRNKNFAVYGVDQDWGRQFGGAVSEQLVEAGWTQAAEEWVALGETDFYPLLTKLQQADISLAVGTMSDLNAATAFIKQADEIGLEALIVIDGLSWLSEWYDLTGDASNYIIDQMATWSTDEQMAFVDAYVEKYGYEPSAATAGLAYDYTGFWIDVVEKCIEEHGDVNNETLMQTAEDWVISGEMSYTDGIVMECYQFTPETFPDPVVGEGMYIFPVVQFFDGEPSTIWPASVANAELQVPDKAQG